MQLISLNYRTASLQDLDEQMSISLTVIESTQMGYDYKTARRLCVA